MAWRRCRRGNSDTVAGQTVTTKVTTTVSGRDRAAFAVAFSNRRMSMKSVPLDRRESGTGEGGRVAADFLSLVFRIGERTVIIIACAGWKSGKPAFGFPLFQAAHAWRWKCENPAVFAGFSRGGGKRGKPVVGFPRFPRPRHFHRPCHVIGTAAGAAPAPCIVVATAIWRRSFDVHTRCRLSPAHLVPARPGAGPA